ncbi:MAG: hypothetical protein U9Q07_04195 [Planctomycetota bacterium]|nr:hypothetical protein [Planctomycetota bacterium]
MPNKKQLLTIAKELGLDCDLKWTKREMEEAIEAAQAEIAALEKEDEPEAAPEEPVIKDLTSGIFSEPESEVEEPTINPEPVAPPKPEVPSPVMPPKEPTPEPTPKNIPGTYKCHSGLTWQGDVYDIGDSVVMDDESAKVHVRDGVIGPMDAVAAENERAKMLPAGEYVLEYDLTLDGQVHTMDSIVDLTAEQANMYEKIGAIKPR